MFDEENNTERFFVPAHGVDDVALKAGFAWLLHFANEGGYRKAAVFVPTLGQVESLGRAIGASGATALKKDRHIQASGITIDLLVQRGLPSSFEDGPVLAVWVDDKQLDKLDDLRPPGLCAIPWNRVDIDGWKADWNPTDARTGEGGGREATVSNPVVVAALESLTSRVNVSTGLGHPSDKAAAVELFKLLMRAHEDFNPTEVRAWAVRHGWSAHHARDLSEVAQKIQDGRRVQTQGRGGWNENILNIWREKASN